MAATACFEFKTDSLSLTRQKSRLEGTSQPKKDLKHAAQAKLELL